MSGKKGRSGRPPLEQKNVQMTGSVPEAIAEDIREAAVLEDKTPNSFVGKLILKGWNLFSLKEEEKEED